MKRVLVLGNNVDSIRRLIRDKGLEDVTEKPDVILTYGGDGLLPGSEREWPGVPKPPPRNSRPGQKRQAHSNGHRYGTGEVPMTADESRCIGRAASELSKQVERRSEKEPRKCDVLCTEGRHDLSIMALIGWCWDRCSLA